LRFEIKPKEWIREVKIKWIKVEDFPISTGIYVAESKYLQK